jgi:hypothetical protein
MYFKFTLNLLQGVNKHFGRLNPNIQIKMIDHTIVKEYGITDNLTELTIQNILEYME